MDFVWLIAPCGVCLAGLLYVLAPVYLETRAERLLLRGRDRQAARCLETALKIWIRRASPAGAASAQAGLARVRLLQGRPAQGNLLLEQAKQNLGVHAGKPSRRLILTLTRVGQAALAAGRCQEAATLAEQAAALAPRLLSPKTDPARGTLEVLLANAYSGLELFEKAHVHYEAALEAYQRSLGDESPESGAVWASMAASLARQERWREAREAGLEAVDILDHTGSTRLPDALDALAELHARRGRLAEAEGLRLSICHLWESLGGANSAALAREYERRAELLRSMERLTEAGFLMGKAEEIRRTAVAGA